MENPSTPGLLEHSSSPESTSSRILYPSPAAPEETDPDESDTDELLNECAA
jgi:hypothetical protein